MNASIALGSGVALLLALAAGDALAQRMDRVPPLPTGSTWVNLMQDSGSFGTSGGEVRSEIVEMEWEGRQHPAVRTPTGALIMTPQGEWIGTVGLDGKLASRWDPPLHYEWPLEVGKTWTRTHQVKLPGADPLVPMELTTTVEAFEEVTVPAGTFKAFRIRSVDSFHNVSTSWFVPELRLFARRIQERTERHGAGAGRREFILKSHDLRLPQ